MMPPDPSLWAQGAGANGTAVQRRGGVLFRAGTNDYFLPADVVLRVLSMPKVQPLPGAPPEVLGYALVEGEAALLLGVGQQTAHLVVCAYGTDRVGLVGAQVLRTGLFAADPHGPGVIHNGRVVPTFDLAGLCAAAERGVPSARLSG